MKYTAYALFFFGLVFLSEVSAQSTFNTATLTSPNQPKGKHSICFSENARPCGKRTPDLGVLSFGEVDWFMVGTQPPVRTKMTVLGKYAWSDKFDIPSLEPYPIGIRKPTPSVEFSSVEPENAEPVISPSGKPFVKPMKVAKTSSEYLMVMEGHIYLLRVRDHIHDFYVLLRVDQVVRGKSIRISWKQFSTP